MSSQHQNTAHIVWFKRDLRIYDHAPLFQAARQGNIIPLYVIEPELWNLPDTSRRHWHFIHDSLCDLDHHFKLYGGKLIIRIGNLTDILNNFRQKFTNIFLWSHEETGNAWTFARDIQVKKWCKEHNIQWIEYPSNGVVRCLKKRNEWSKIRDTRMKEDTIPLPPTLRFSKDIMSEALPSKDSLYFGIPIIGTTQQGGRTQGLKVLQSFLQDRGRRYMLTISKPGVSARHCSRLSAHIAYGDLSIREIEQATKQRILDLQESNHSDDHFFIRNLHAFLARLSWRCHFIQKLEQQPNIEKHCMHNAYEDMRALHFREDYFRAWKEGKTGYPLIDACMRSLIENGWITFRMRAMLVSFASYHLWLDWRQTAPYLAKLFTDYEPGIHYAQFQMQSGVTGINTIRIYNPIKQSIDHDPDGKFIYRYLPELEGVSKSFIHEPWRMQNPPAHYPLPIVDHDTAIKFARSEIAKRRKYDGFHDQSQAIHHKLGSRRQHKERSISSKTLKDNTKQFTLDF